MLSRNVIAAWRDCLALAIVSLFLAVTDELGLLNLLPEKARYRTACGEALPFCARRSLPQFREWTFGNSLESLFPRAERFTTVRPVRLPVSPVPARASAGSGCRRPSGPRSR